MKESEVRIPEILAQVGRTNEETIVTTTVYFFCSTNSEGTEGIRRVKNFVAFLGSYRGTFCA